MRRESTTKTKTVVISTVKWPRASAKGLRRRYSLFFCPQPCLENTGRSSRYQHSVHSSGLFCTLSSSAETCQPWKWPQMPSPPAAWVHLCICIAFSLPCRCPHRELGFIRELLSLLHMVISKMKGSPLSKMYSLMPGLDFPEWEFVIVTIVNMTGSRITQEMSPLPSLWGSVSRVTKTGISTLTMSRTVTWAEVPD